MKIKYLSSFAEIWLLSWKRSNLMHDNLTFQRLSDISVDISCFFLACWRTREFANIYRCYRRADAQCREEDWVDGVCKYAGQGWDNTITEQSDEVRCKNESQEDFKQNVKAMYRLFQPITSLWSWSPSSSSPSSLSSLWPSWPCIWGSSSAKFASARLLAMHLTSAKPSNHNHSHQFTIIIVIIIIVLMIIVAIAMTGLNEEEAQMAGKQLSGLPARPESTQPNPSHPFPGSVQ